MSENTSKELSISDLLSLILKQKKIVIATTVLGLLGGAFKAWITEPVYQVDGLVQIEENGSSAGAALGELGEMFETASPAEAEIEILKSRMVLTQVVNTLKLDLVATPSLMPVIGKALNRSKINRAEVKIESLNIPKSIAEEGVFVQEKDEKISVYLGEDNLGVLEKGRTFSKEFKNDTLKIFLSHFENTSGIKYELIKKNLLKTISDLKQDLSAGEKGKKSGMLALSLQDEYVDDGVVKLNEIMNAYLKQNVERKSEEAQKTLEFLESKLPELKQKLEDSENLLNDYRNKVGSIDLSAESQLMLSQMVDSEASLFELKQKRDELSKLYQENHPNIVTIQSQINNLQNKIHGVNAKAQKLPETQQEIIKLSRDVKVNNELYTTLLNNSQQLKIIKAGKVGNIRIIDRPLVVDLPVKPKKKVMVILGLMLGIFVGVAFVLFKFLTNKGVRDSKEIEAGLGLSVYATLPHSDFQKDLYKKVKQKESGVHLLTHHHSNELGAEAFRSLRTALHFSLLDAKNNIVMITGPSPSIGKSFIATNLANVFAQSGAKVLVIDGDMRKGYMQDVFGLKRGLGLSEILSGQKTFAECVNKDLLPHLDFLSTGTLPPNASELLLNGRFSDLLKELSEEYDHVIIDAPPVLAVTDAAVIGAQCGSSLMVARYGLNPIGELELCKKRLEMAGVELKGVLLNDVEKNGEKYGYAYGYSYQ